MECWHMSGAGNDFMVIDARGETLDFSKLAKELCTLSGADGFMAVDNTDQADFRLHFYNSDGSRGEMCGNGARCVCRFAYEHGIAPENMTVLTDAGIVPGQRLDENQYRVRLNLPSVADLQRKQDIAYIELGDPGVPHAVLEAENPTWENREALRELGKSLRYDPAFPKGANVNFYSWLEPGHVQILTYERGVEDFTRACGTGTGSTAFVLYRLGQLPGKYLVAEAPGGTLKVKLTAEGEDVSVIELEGPTEVLKAYEI